MINRNLFSFFYFIGMYSLESVNGGISLFINLMLNKELSQKREHGNHQCGGCGKKFNKTSLIYKNNNIYWPSTYPENGVCGDVSNYHDE